MAHDIYQAPQADLHVAGQAQGATFYVVSKRKLWILSVVTLGLYIFARHYQHWRAIKYSNESMRDIMPAARALFAIFYVIGLFNWLNEPKVEEQYKWSPDANAWTYIVVGIVGQILSFIPHVQTSIILSSANVLISLIVPIIIVSKAQTAANIVCDDFDGVSNNSFTVVNILWMLLGLFIWTGFIVGTLSPTTI